MVIGGQNLQAQRSARFFDKVFAWQQRVALVTGVRDGSGVELAAARGGAGVAITSGDLDATEGRAQPLSAFVKGRIAETALGRMGAASGLLATVLGSSGRGGELITGETIVCVGGHSPR